MWYLKSSTGELLYLKSNKSLTFGRKKGEIVLENDDSVSRLHASVRVQLREEIQLDAPTSCCKIKDLNSKYGTYILKGGEVYELSKEEYDLEDKDKIRFGLMDHIYTVVYVPFITVVSSLIENDKSKLQPLMEEIDGVISIDWISTCTHLTVSKPTLTEKVACALASAVPIVDMHYWEKVKYAFENGEKMPDPNNFVPDHAESLIKKGIKLTVNEERKTLFKHFIFVYFNKRQYKKYEKMIKMAGGQSLLYTIRPLTERQLRAPNVIVVQYSSSDETQSTQSVVPEYETIHDTLQRSKRRMISESEIPLAIMHCSMKTHCNPKFTFSDLLKRSETQEASSTVLAFDTYDMLRDENTQPSVISNVRVKPVLQINSSTTAAKIIPETYESSSCGDLSNNDCVVSQGTPPCANKIIPESIEFLSTSYSSNPGCQESIEKSNAPEKSVVYIPETNDSNNMSDLVEKKDTQKVMDSAQICRQELNEKSEILDNLDLVIPETMTQPSNRMKVDLDVRLMSPKELNSIKSENTSDKVVMHEISGNLSEFYDDDNNDDDDNRIVKTLKATKSKTNHTKGPEVTLGCAMVENRKRKNRNYDEEWCENDDNVGFLKPSWKKESTKDPSRAELPQSQIVTSAQKSVRNNHDVAWNPRSSFLRAELGCKTFRKVYNKIPAKRITLADMYVWNQCNAP